MGSSHIAGILLSVALYVHGRKSGVKADEWQRLVNSRSRLQKATKNLYFIYSNLYPPSTYALCQHIFLLAELSHTLHRYIENIPSLRLLPPLHTPDNPNQHRDQRDGAEDDGNSVNGDFFNIVIAAGDFA